MMAVLKAPGTNTRVSTGLTDEVVEAPEPSLPGGVPSNREVCRQCDFISVAVNNVGHALRDAAIFVSVVVILFLLMAWMTLISVKALPLSLAMAPLVLNLIGEQINMVTRGGLAIAAGIA